ncbi:hypothetical protein [uncultured Psychromonas sp.]|uniref:hypothetical protein n=1 Tax=uncultured Psychromonas sp. TaxID=173974 RepID=UPI0026277C4A|nr:hypothetical protein [uncultured Psychromonas sp.]
MCRPIELLITLNSAKSVSLNNHRYSARIDNLKRNELYALLDSANSTHKLGILIIKTMYSENDEISACQLIQQIEHYCRAAGLRHPDIFAIIIMQMLIDKPLVIQQQKIKSLYKKYGVSAEQNKAAQTNYELQIEQIYDQNSYRAEQLKQIIFDLQKKLDKYADEKSKNTIICPKCVGYGCQICTNGKIKITMDDVLQQFSALKIDFNKQDFLKRYWNQLLIIISELEQHKNQTITEINNLLANSK